MKKFIPNIFYILIGCLSGNICLAQDVDNYSHLECKDSIPEIFTEHSSTTFAKDYAQNTYENLDENFFLITRFYIGELLRGGKILFNDPLSGYLSEVARYLLKDDIELFNRLHFFVIKTNAVNAFSTDQGIIFFTSGLLAHLESEAQIAFILSHEIAHYTEKHLRQDYIDYQDYLKSRGKYKRLSYYEAVNNLSLYSKELELEADKKGIELYLKSGYNPLEITKAFTQLHFSYLPFEQKQFKPSFLSTKNLVIPEALFSDTIRKINTNLDIDDEGSTHPNMKKRIEAGSELIPENKKHDSLRFIVSEEQFYKVQLLAKLESINIDISTRYYVDALYSVYVLSEYYPNSRFLDLSKIKCLYGLAKYKNGGRIEEVTSRLRHVEGESFKLHSFINSLSREQLNILAFRHLYDMTIKYPDDEPFQSYFEDFKKEFALRSEVDFSSLKDKPFVMVQDTNSTIRFNIDDSMKRIDQSNLLKSEKLVRKKELLDLNKNVRKNSTDNTFHLFGLWDLVKDGNLITELEQLKLVLEVAAIESDSVQKIEEQQIKKQGYALGIKKILVVDPTYVDYSNTGNKKFVRSEERKISTSNIYKNGFEQINIETILLDPYDLEKSDIQSYNEIALIKDWMSETLDHGDIKMINSTHHLMTSLTQKYGTSHVLFSGIYGYRQNFFLINDYFEFISLVMNISTDSVEMRTVKKVDLSSMEKVVRAHIFNVLYQINSER